jgi:opacity protein-like surface antigen
MRRPLVIPILVLACCIATQKTLSQVEKPVSLGIRGGVNFGDASLDPDLPSGQSKSMRTAIAAGGYAEFGVAEGLFITGEVLYAQRGIKVSGTEGGVRFEGTAKLDYFYVPLSLKYKFKVPDSKVTPYIFGGPSLAFNSKAEVEIEAQGQTVTEDIKDQTESTDLAAHIGAGIEIEASSDVSVLFDGRYSLSFSDASKEADQKIKGRNIMVLAGVKFKLR